ncbi:MAG TPA: VgrG-related protein [Jatrophihabitans sp.]|nr:VgrG-related protein [Jatrophihabitans sp.]
MSPSAYGTRPRITVDGTPLADDVLPSLIKVVIDAQLHLPDMFALEFLDHGRDLVRRAGFDFGGRIEITATGADAADEAGKLLVGEVTGLEQDTDATGTWTIVRGYDLSHRLCRGRRTRTFLDATDGDIVRRVATDAGLELGDVDDDGAVHPHVGQVNLTDWEFLRARANERGREVAVVNGQLVWHAPVSHDTAPSSLDDLETPPQPAQLLLGTNLLRLSPRVTAAEQVGEVWVRGWNPETKQPVRGSAKTSTVSANSGADPSELAGRFSAAPFLVADRPVRDEQEADAIAAAVAEQIAGAHAEMTGLALGDPKLIPGAAVSVSGVGWPHDGDYVLSGARHRYDETGYHTEFTVSGRQERTLLGLASLGATKQTHRGSGRPWPGLVIGQVTDINDPDQRFRVKVAFPWLSDDYESWWARVVQPGAGDGRGLAWLPEVGDEVLVGFVHGDVRDPYVLGGLYNGTDHPMMNDQLVDGSAGQVLRRVLGSRTGHQLVFSDDDQGSQIQLATGDGSATITLDSTNTKIVIDGTGTVTIHAGGPLKLDSDGDIELNANGGDLKLTASGELKLSGSTGASIDGGPQVSVSGSIIKLN